MNNDEGITVKEGMMNVGMRVRKMLKEGMNTYQEGMMNEGRNNTYRLMNDCKGRNER